MYLLQLNSHRWYRVWRGTTATRWAPTPPIQLAQRLKRRADFLVKELRLFPGCKVPTLVKAVVVNQVGISFLSPTPWGLVELIRKGAHGNRDGDSFRGEKGQLAFPIQPSRRD